MCFYVFVALAFYFYYMQLRFIHITEHYECHKEHFFRIPKFLHSLDKRQVSKSFQGHCCWLVTSEFSKTKTYVCCLLLCFCCIYLERDIVGSEVEEPLAGQ